MRQYAKVIETDENMAKVEIRRHGSCNKCGECKEQSSNELEIKANNPIGAKTGEIVAIELESKNVLGALFVVYFLPLINMFIGYLVGKGISGNLGINNTDLMGAVIAVLFLVTSFLIAKKYGERGSMKGKYQPTIKRTVDPTVEDINQMDHQHHH